LLLHKSGFRDGGIRKHCRKTGSFGQLLRHHQSEYRSGYASFFFLAFAAKQLKGKKKLLAGASDPNPATTIKYMKYAVDLGYDAAMICPPYYFTMSQNDVVRYYKYLGKQNICDIVLYKIPMFTNTIEMPSFEQLLDERRIIGMKDSSANIKQIVHEADLVRRNRPDFSLLGGTDDSLVPSLLAGCVGSVTAFSVIVPEVNAKIYELFNQGRVAEAMALNQKALRLLRFADSTMFPSGYKLVYEQRGLPMGHCQVVDETAIRSLRLAISAELETLLRSI